MFLPVLLSALCGALAQTVYHERNFFDLHVSNDGRIEALINANDKSWMTVYRQFIELDTDTGELMLAFDVGSSDYPAKEAMETDAHIMTTTLASGTASWALPDNATQNDDGYVHSNMVLWYDGQEKQMVMVYQSSSTTKSQEDGFDVHLTLVRRDSGDDEWSSDQEFLSNIDSAHVRYQFIESLTTNQNGYANQLIIPIYNQAAVDSDGNYDSKNDYDVIVRIDRGLTADASVTTSYVEEHVGQGNGYFQASIVRVPSETNPTGSQLVAFSRDAEGYWLYRSTSDDDGYTWTDPYMSAIPNPDQTAQAIYLHTDLLMLIYNPSQSMTSEPSPGDMYANAHHLAVGLSADYGMTWQWARMLEYAYDGMFNSPVGLQDPDCNNVYLTYSVMTDETNGCQMLDECNVESQGTQSYIKFTIINEQWVMNEFNYKYDIDNCAWQLPQSLRMTTTSFESVLPESTGLSTVIILSIVAGVVLLLNMVMCYGIFFRNKGYNDLEMTQQTNDPNDYETTN